MLHFLSLRHSFSVHLTLFLYIMGSLLIHCALLRHLSSSVWSHSPQHFVSVCHADSGWVSHLRLKKRPKLFHMRRNVETNTSRNIWTLSHLLSNLYLEGLKSPIMIQSLVVLTSLRTLQRSLCICKPNPEGIQQTLHYPRKAFYHPFPKLFCLTVWFLHTVPFFVLSSYWVLGVQMNTHTWDPRG